MKILYKPVGLIAGVIAARLGRSVFKSLWSRIDADEPPKPSTKDAPLPKVLGASALEGATMAGVAAGINRVSAKMFYHLTGIWPGESEPKKADERNR